MKHTKHTKAFFNAEMQRPQRLAEIGNFSFPSDARLLCGSPRSLRLCVYSNSPSRGGLFKRQESELVGKLAVFVFRVGNQFLMAAVHHPIQIFQRNLADNVRQ